MANRGVAYGFSRQCHMKILGKFDLERAQEALEWIQAVVGEQLDPAAKDITDQTDVKTCLKDGQMLCRLMNNLNPGAIRKINESKLAFKEMENIEMFLKACRDFGMKEVDTFQTQDLYEAKAMFSVINCLYSLGSLARKNGFAGRTIGVKIAEENKRTFTEDQIAKGKMYINLQYGSTLGASQKGMRPYGASLKM